MNTDTITIAASWFEVRIAFEKVCEDGVQRKVKETYVVRADSFAEAEARILQEMAVYNAGAIDVVAVARAPYKEIAFLADPNADVDTHYYKCRLQLITIDERTARERKSTVYMLVQSATLNSALASVDTIMRRSCTDYVSASGTETNVCDIFK